ncbi:ABC transporter ATP-binding protein [Cellulomonas phragmiteti]|uniref:ABC transporter ATP-binding protein n=1 Tax=Cellulomonas phragmiteti TaxID=478780 RepID=A0ABQ4DQU7_9CELL|nr:ATP-binding cassette domain-containing protein [Cellulomonas phragmiteti]GIG41713.1 ABC transporter ATP-binding protein [Cellulomonas phragmiteti]
MTVHLHRVVVRHAGRTLVDVADVHLEPGRAVTVVGESGSGKSLLAHAALGTLPAGLAVHGAMSIDGVPHDVGDQAGRRPLWGRTLALLPQEPVLALDPTMRVRDVVAEGAPTFARDRRAARRAALERLAGLGVAHAAGAYPHQLSGGMAQRVAFAAATIGEAPVLVADEPSKGLDVAARDDLAALLRRHVEGGGVLLTITHDLDLARALGGDVLVMREAEVLERGPVEQVLTTPTHPYTARLLAAEPARWAKAWMRDGGPPEGSPLLVHAEQVTRTLGGRRLFTGLDLDLRAGDRVALTGPSGSGKTTLGRVLLRRHPVDSGRVTHHDLARRRGRAPVQQLHQDPTQSFPAFVPLRAALGDAVRRHGVAPGRLEELLGTMRLDPGLLERRPGGVSGGELQRLAIIRAMLLHPALLLADEPTSRLDLLTQEETLDALMGQVEQQGTALLLVTHDTSLAHAVADREVVLPGGVTTPTAVLAGR